MLDTIVLTLSSDMFRILEPDRFEPSARLITDPYTSFGGRGYKKCQQNPTKQELRNGFYKPRLTLTNRFNHLGNRDTTLKIEFSLPKLLYGNNFDELTAVDLEKVTSKLLSRLSEMGVQVSITTILNAPVSSIHYSKNIPLVNGITPHYIIGKIQQSNVSLCLDINQTDYRNSGHSFKWHANSYEIAFYDKIKDLESAKKSAKRSLEIDNLIQLGLFDDLQKRNHFEVLRMEVRLNKRQKIKQVFKKLNLSCNLTYQNLVSEEASRLVLGHYLTEIEHTRLPFYDYKSNDINQLLPDMIINNPNLKTNKMLVMYGLTRALEIYTPRKLRSMLGNLSYRQWYRLMSDVKNLKLPLSQSPFTFIRQQLADFKPLRLVDYQDRLLHNVN
ncbi:MAG: hypothetical protein ABIJ33_00660 [Patescibacteria group bacterium]